MYYTSALQFPIGRSCDKLIPCPQSITEYINTLVETKISLHKELIEMIEVTK
jgi:hypothetical protein